MKWVLVVISLFLTNCASQSTALVSENTPNKNISVNQAPDTTNSSNESQKINTENVEKLKIQNEKFKAVPEEFRKIEFRNFTYPVDYPRKTVTLKEGEYKYEDKKGLGGTSFSLRDVFFVDITNDKRKEAVVFLGRVDCGASCDGGSDLAYVFEAKQGKPKLIWKYFFGSMAYDCGLKTLNVKEEKITFEVFGRCTDKMKFIPSEGLGFSKFSAVDFTEFVFAYDGNNFIREKKQIHAVGKINYWNHQPEISINE